MEENRKRVTIGSKVKVEIYLGRASISREDKSVRKYFAYERFFGPNNDKNYTETYTIWENLPKNSKQGDTSCKSFLGRALFGRSINQEVEVNVGGLEIGFIRIGMLSGNHLKLKIIFVD